MKKLSFRHPVHIYDNDAVPNNGTQKSKTTLADFFLIRVRGVARICFFVAVSPFYFRNDIINTIEIILYVLRMNQNAEHSLAGWYNKVGQSVIAWLIAISRVQSIPGFQELMQEQMRRQQPDAQFSSDQINMIIAITGPVLGLCLGIFSLLLSLGLGALGGWLAARRPTRQPAPPMGPPPLDPPL